MSVELIWDGKYTDKERRQKRAPLKLALPFQTVETINESVQERQRSLMFGATEWRNRLIWGDKKYILPSLLPEFAGKVNLIYIDPPFDTGANFSFQVEVEGEQFTKEPSIIEQKAYRDTWGRGLDSYLQWFYETAVMLRELLADDGSIYVHLDWYIAGYAKAVMDEVFGADNSRNELIWKRQTSKGGAFEKLAQYGRIHETIYFYTKSTTYTWNQQFTDYSQEHLDKSYKHLEAISGRRFSLRDLTAAGARKGDSGKPILIKGEQINLPNGRHWAVGLNQGETVQEAVDRLVSEGKIWYEKGRMPRLKLFLDEMPGVPLQSIWTDLLPVQAQSEERLNYPTQKPEALFDRIIKASSNGGDLVLDCFCGSGTTAAVAEKLGRHWITCDLGRFAIHTARKRLLSITDVKPFEVQNLGKYERQAWQKDEFGAVDAEARVDAYNKFILELYRAEKLNGFAWLHGLKSGRAVHVGSVDSPVTLGDVKAILLEWRKNFVQSYAFRRDDVAEKEITPKGVTLNALNAAIDILGWEFALDLNETAKQQAQEAGVDLRFLTIPREVLEKKAVEQGDIQFFELAALSVETSVKKKRLDVKLTNFIAPLEYVPQDAREKITKWEAWIDYWAVDFDFKGDTFHNQWQSYRTRKNKKLETKTEWTYTEAGTYNVQIKVIDILGNDTTKTVEVEIKCKSHDVSVQSVVSDLDMTVR